MPNKPRTNGRKPAGVDTRTRRTTTALALALIQLIQESDGGFREITVRQILQRAGIGRTTLLALPQQGRRAALEVRGDIRRPQGAIAADTGGKPRLFPVSEFLEHLAGARPLMGAFRKAGLADDMRSQFIGYAADIIECRIRDLKLSTTVQPRLAARMLAAALIESTDWWFDHESIAASEIDAAFFICWRER